MLPKKLTCGLEVRIKREIQSLVRREGAMRQIEIKYTGNCKRCDALLEIGKQAMYEKSMGVFCLGCEPKDTEEIRNFRQIKADLKATKYNKWAEKRELKAQTQLNSYPEIRHDIAFNTQPGHIPFRERMIKSDDKAFESLQIARQFREKVARLEIVRVAGDAERRRQNKRDINDTIIKQGSEVKDFCFGRGVVIRANKKTYTIKFASGGTYARDKSYITF